MPADPQVRRAMAILSGVPQIPPARQVKVKPEARVPPRRRPPAPPARSVNVVDPDAENVAPRRMAPRREPPVKPVPRKAPQRKPPAPKSSIATPNTSRQVLAQMSANQSDTVEDAPRLQGTTPTNSLGPCPRQAPQQPSTRDKESPELCLQPQHSMSEDEDDCDELLRAVEAEVLATAEMLQPENRHNIYSSSESDSEGGSESESDGEDDSIGAYDDDDVETEHNGSTDGLDNSPQKERVAEEEKAKGKTALEEETAALADALVDTQGDLSDSNECPITARNSQTNSVSKARLSSDCLEPLRASVGEMWPAQLVPAHKPAHQPAASQGGPTLLTPAESSIEISARSPETAPTFSIRASRSISSCFDTGSNAEATAVAPRPVVRSARLTLSNQPARVSTAAATILNKQKPPAPANTAESSESSRYSINTGCSDETDSAEVVRLRQRVAILEKELAAKESALIEAFSIIDQLSKVERGAA